MHLRGLPSLASAINPTQDLFVFGSSSLAPFVSNWLSALAIRGTTSVLVGALDDELYAACVAARVPVIHIGQNHGRGDPGYIRKDYGRFKRMGV